MKRFILSAAVLVIVGGGMFGGYCADKIARSSGDHPLRVLVLEAGPFLVPTLVQNLPRAGLDVPDPIFPSADNGVPRDLVWGIPGAATCSSSARTPREGHRTGPPRR